MYLLSAPRWSVCWALSRLDRIMFSPILSFGRSVSAPVPAPLPCAPGPQCLPPLVIALLRAVRSLLLFGRAGLLRLVVCLAGVVVLFVIAFLVHAAAADRKLA